MNSRSWITVISVMSSHFERTLAWLLDTYGPGRQVISRLDAEDHDRNRRGFAVSAVGRSKAMSCRCRSTTSGLNNGFGHVRDVRPRRMKTWRDVLSGCEESRQPTKDERIRTSLKG